MKVTHGLLLAGCGLLCVGSLRVSAGDMYPVTLRGTVYEVNGQGRIAGTPTTQAAMLQNLANSAGMSATDLTLVYHVGGNAMGDTIDVIDRRDGRVLSTPYGFYFGEAFARRALYSASRTDQRRLDYVYTPQAGVALGSAIVIKKEVRVSGGGTRLLVSGSMQWIVTPENGDPGQICTAKFRTGRKLNFQYFHL